MLKTTGTITLGNRVVVSDPCYSLGTWCQGILENMLPGEYECIYNFDENERCVSEIYIVHSSLPKDDLTNTLINCTIAPFEVGVDSGQAGFYDYDYYVSHHTPKLDEDWYDKVCNLTCNIVDNPSFGQFLNDESFSAHIDTLIEKLKTVTKPDDCTLLQFSLCLYADTTFGHNNAYRDYFRKKLIDANWFSTNNALQYTDEHTVKRIKKADSIIISSLSEAECLIPYEQRCHRLWTHTASPCDNKAFVALSGLGDGGYVCWYHTDNDNKIDCVGITFYD